MWSWVVRLLGLTSEKQLLKTLIKNTKVISQKGLKGYITKRASKALLRKNRAYNPTQIQKQLKTRLNDKYKYVGAVNNSSWIRKYNIFTKKLKLKNGKWYKVNGLTKQWVNQANKAPSFGVRLWDTLWLHKRRNSKSATPVKFDTHILNAFKKEQVSFANRFKRKAHIGSIKGIVRSASLKKGINYRQSISTKLVKKLIF